MSVLDRLREHQTDRRERREAQRVAMILAGECVCPGWDQGGFRTSTDCPQMALHLADLAGYTTWECRACELPTMFARSGPNPICQRCGSADGWLPSTTEEMLRFTRDALEETYGNAR